MQLTSSENEPNAVVRARAKRVAGDEEMVETIPEVAGRMRSISGGVTVALGVSGASESS